MAYNNYFPNYQQPNYYPQQQIPQPQITQQQSVIPQNNSNQITSSIIWVQGEAGAKSYLVAPNTTIALWDSERKTIYLKSADASGMPSMKYIDYTIRENNQLTQNNNDSVDYATRDDIENLQNEIVGLRKKIESINAKRNNNTSHKKEGVLDE